MITSLNSFVISQFSRRYIVTSPYPALLLYCYILSNPLLYCYIPLPPYYIITSPYPPQGGNWILVNYLTGFQYIKILCSVVKYSQTVLRGIE